MRSRSNHAGTARPTVGDLRTQVSYNRARFNDLARELGRQSKFIQELGKGPPLSLVEHLSVRWLPASGRFAAFGIRYAEFEP